jgi:HSP20 family molecular chaperone IbpA
MRSRFLNLIFEPHRFPVLLFSVFLGVVGIKAVFIAHTHKMITGQPLLLGQDHRSFSHLPPFILTRIRDFFNGSAFKRPSSNPVPEASLDDNWDRVLIIPFISLSDAGNQYIVLVEAPGLSISNIAIRLTGRELTIAPHANNGNKVLVRDHRIRLPGPVAATGPPTAEAVAAGRLRVTLRKVETKMDSEPTNGRY